MDPSHFAREYLAEFIDDAPAWLPSELIEQAVDIGITERPSLPGIKYVMAIDASGAGACAFAVSIGNVEDQGDGTIVVVQDVLRSFTKPPPASSTSGRSSARSSGWPRRTTISRWPTPTATPVSGRCRRSKKRPPRSPCASPSWTRP